MTQTASTLRQVLAAAAFAATMLSAIAVQAAPLKVIVSKAEVLTLDESASVVLIANPNIADVVLEQGHILFVLGRVLGETRLFVYDNKGNRLLERDVVVVPQTERAVTVTRDTKPTEYSCDPRCITAENHSPTEVAKPSAAPGGPVEIPTAPPTAGTVTPPPAAPTAGFNTIGEQ